MVYTETEDRGQAVSAVRRVGASLDSGSERREKFGRLKGVQWGSCGVNWLRRGDEGEVHDHVRRVVMMMILHESLSKWRYHLCIRSALHQLNLQRSC